MFPAAVGDATGCRVDGKLRHPEGDADAAGGGW